MTLSRRLVLLLSAVAMSCSWAPESKARSVADRWVASLDRNDFDGVWDLTSGMIRSKVERERWLRTMLKARDHGEVKARRFLDAEVLKDPKHVAPGDYLSVRYETTFTDEDAVEIVLIALTGSDDHRLTVAAYFVSTRSLGSRVGWVGPAG